MPLTFQRKQVILPVEPLTSLLCPIAFYWCHLTCFFFPVFSYKLEFGSKFLLHLVSTFVSIIFHMWTSCCIVSRSEIRHFFKKLWFSYVQLFKVNHTHILVKWFYKKRLFYKRTREKTTPPGAIHSLLKSLCGYSLGCCGAVVLTLLFTTILGIPFSLLCQMPRFLDPMFCSFLVYFLISKEPKLYWLLKERAQKVNILRTCVFENVLFCWEPPCLVSETVTPRG